jgi:hypothetical protein
MSAQALAEAEAARRGLEELNKPPVTPPRTTVKRRPEPKPSPSKQILTDTALGLLPRLPRDIQGEVRRFLASKPSPSSMQLLQLIDELEDFPPDLSRAEPQPDVEALSDFRASQAPIDRKTRRIPVTSVRRNGDIVTERQRTDLSDANYKRVARLELTNRLADERLFARPDPALSTPLDAPRVPPTASRQARSTKDTWSFDDDFGWDAQRLQSKPSQVSFANPDYSGTEAERAIQSQLKTINTSVQQLSAAEKMLQGASPLDKVNLLRQLQEDNNLQALVAAGLMKWSDVLMSNPAKGASGHVDGVDPGKPVINEPKLKDLRSKLAALGLQRTNDELRRVVQRDKQRVTGGYKPSSRQDYFPGRKIWTGPRYMPGRMNTNNVAS